MATIQDLEKQIGELKKELLEARLANTPEAFDDYEFETASGPVKLSELFGDKSELLIWHNMGKGCNYCTLWADGLTGYVKQIQSRCPVVLVSPDQVSVQQTIAKERDWNFPMVRDASHAFSKAAGFLGEYEGKPSFWPGLSAFAKDADGKITRTNHTVFGPGDDFCLVWPALELLPGGIGDWEPA